MPKNQFAQGMKAREKNESGIWNLESGIWFLYSARGPFNNNACSYMIKLECSLRLDPMAELIPPEI